MAIQMRRGSNEYYNAAKMEAGEFASVSDTEKLYHSFKSGTAKEVAMMDDVEKLVSEEIAGIEIPQPVVSHTELAERDAADQHPISAITGLQTALDGKQPTGNYLTSESDPTVPEWAKAATKPTYTAEEVHALPDTTVIPSLDGYATEEYVDNAIANSGVIVTASGESIVLTDSSDKPLEGLVLYGKTTQDGTPSPENPIPLVSAGDGGELNTTVCGKNFYDLSKSWGYDKYQPFLCAEGDYYSVAIYPSNGTAQVNIKFMYSDGSSGYYLLIGTNESNNQWYLFSRKATKDITRICLYNLNDDPNAVDRTADKIMVCKGQITTMTDDLYEPYTAQILTAQTPNGLPGIPVTSGGNYTDENGQQWICDEIDFGREVYVQRCGTISSYDGESIDTPYVSSTGELSAGAEVIYALTEPVETSLTAEEIAAYKTLHTNKPNTTILNDGGAGMSVSYVADTKAYIDNKFAALEAAILSTGGNV